MTIAFVTGANGFIGRALVNQLLQQNIQVKALTPADEADDWLLARGVDVIHGELDDRSLLYESMVKANVVFHLAGWFKLGSADWRQAEAINVHQTRTVLETALEAGVPKIVYTSTVAILGDTKGVLVDESELLNTHNTTSFKSHYERTKWMAYHDVVRPLVKKGAPIITVLVGMAYGPDDPHLIGDLMRRFVQNRLPFPFLPGPSTIFTFAHVDDIAAGHLLAAEKGKIGEAYILSGPPVALGEMTDFWARLNGKVPPALHIPSRLLRAIAPLVEWIEAYRPLPAVFSSETLRTMGASQTGSSNKAESDLGWRQRSLQVGMLDTFAHINQQTADQPQPVSRDREVATLALGTATLLFAAWLIYRQFRSK